MCQISGCEPSETELAEKLGWTIEKVRDTEAAMHSVVSYDALKIEKPIDELFELTGGEHHSGVMERKEEVAELLGCLEERERRVLLLHYAPLGGTPCLERASQKDRRESSEEN
jgi:DNA-directed RNA polymerase specialized sigma subunit